MRVQRRLVLLGAALLLAIGAGSVGYYIRAERAAVEWEDRILSDLTLYVTNHDAIEAKRVDDLRPILVAGLESDFYRMVLHWQEHGPARAPLLQCWVAKRIRKMRTDGELFDDERRISESGVEMETINRYLATESLGEPSRDNWMAAEAR